MEYTTEGPIEHDSQERPEDDFIFNHLSAYIHNHIKEEHQHAFLAYAMDQLHSYGNDWANIGWSVLYGRFLMK